LQHVHHHPQHRLFPRGSRQHRFDHGAPVSAMPARLAILRWPSLGTGA
jgi:hypothetical protein